MPKECLAAAAVVLASSSAWADMRDSFPTCQGSDTARTFADSPLLTPRCFAAAELACSWIPGESRTHVAVDG